MAPVGLTVVAWVYLAICFGCGALVRKGMVMWAATSRTRQPEQRDAASHWAGVRPDSSSARRSRSA